MKFGFSIGHILMGMCLGIVIGVIIRTDNNQTSYRNTNEYKVETKTEITESDTTKYIRIVKK